MVLLQFFLFILNVQPWTLPSGLQERLKTQSSPKTAKVYRNFRVSLEAFFLLHRIGVCCNFAHNRRETKSRHFAHVPLSYLQFTYSHVVNTGAASTLLFVALSWKSMSIKVMPCPRTKTAVLRVQLKVSFFTVPHGGLGKGREEEQKTPGNYILTLFKQMKKYLVPKVTAHTAPFLPEQKGNNRKACLLFPFTSWVAISMDTSREFHVHLAHKICFPFPMGISDLCSLC